MNHISGRCPQKQKSPLPAARYPLPAKAETVLLFGVGLEMWKLLQDSSKEDKALLFSFVLFVRFVVQGFYAFAGSGQREAGSGKRAFMREAPLEINPDVYRD